MSKGGYTVVRVTLAETSTPLDWQKKVSTAQQLYMLPADDCRQNEDATLIALDCS